VIQMVIHHRAACLIALLSLVAPAFAANRLGLIVWFAWLGRREQRHHDEATREYWRLHQ